MRFASTGPEDEDVEREGRTIYRVIVILAILGILGAVGWGAFGCYPRPPGPTPSCVEDPSQPWCAPPPFTMQERCTQFRVLIEQDSGVKDDAGVWHYRATATTTATCTDGGAR